MQAPASGIIKNIAVRDGDKVKAGEVLVQLSQVQAQAQVDSLRISTTPRWRQKGACWQNAMG
ncbi:biotin/lipoyl-binding protein [Serratia ureilytica]